MSRRWADGHLWMRIVLDRGILRGWGRQRHFDEAAMPRRWIFQPAPGPGLERHPAARAELRCRRWLGDRFTGDEKRGRLRITSLGWLHPFGLSTPSS